MNIIPDDQSDLLLLELAPPFSDAVPIIQIGDSSLALGERVVIAGYGRSEDGLLGVLRFAKEEVLRVDPVFLHISSFGKSGACTGDSGGPVFWAHDGRVELLGILQEGSSTCKGMERYTRLDARLEWIRFVIEEDPRCL
jgi:hypothetical protein